MSPRPRHTVEAWARHSGGGIAMIMAVALPVLLAVLGVASDFAMLTKLRGDLQAAADAAAIAGAREIPVAKSNEKQVVSAALSFASYELVGGSQASKSDLAAANIAVNAKVVDNFSAVSVEISEAWSPFFAHFIMSDVTPVVVSATARFAGSNNICVLGLADDNSAVLMNSNSQLTANGCSVFADSLDAAGLEIADGAKLTAQTVCSAGGAKVSPMASVDPAAITDCPAVDDPLASRIVPAAGGCDYTNFKATSDVAVTLAPGVYCGGIKVTGKGDVTLGGGIYIMKDGGLKMAGSGTLTGSGVTIVVTGTNPSPITFIANSHVKLSAPSAGPTAGLLLFEDRAITQELNHQISSNDAHDLLGTIYLPKGNLLIDSQQKVADQSAYTAIIVKRLQLNSGPNLVLNANYDATNVPVPTGIRGSSQVILSK